MPTALTANPIVTPTIATHWTLLSFLDKKMRVKIAHQITMELYMTWYIYEKKTRRIALVGFDQEVVFTLYH